MFNLYLSILMALINIILFILENFSSFYNFLWQDTSHLIYFLLWYWLLKLFMKTPVTRNFVSAAFRRWNAGSQNFECVRSLFMINKLFPWQIFLVFINKHILMKNFFGDTKIVPVERFFFLVYCENFVINELEEICEIFKAGWIYLPNLGVFWWIRIFGENTWVIDDLLACHT